MITRPRIVRGVLSGYDSDAIREAAEQATFPSGVHRTTRGTFIPRRLRVITNDLGYSKPFKITRLGEVFRIAAGTVWINGTPNASSTFAGSYPAATDDVTITWGNKWWLWIRIAGTSGSAVEWKTGATVDAKTDTHEPWPLVDAVEADAIEETPNILIQCWDGDIHI